MDQAGMALTDIILLQCNWEIEMSSSSVPFKRPLDEWGKLRDKEHR